MAATTVRSMENAGKKLDLKSALFCGFKANEQTSPFFPIFEAKNWERGNPVRVVGGTTFDNYWTDSWILDRKEGSGRREEEVVASDKSKKSLVPSSGLRNNLSDWTTAMAPAERVS
jgi:hypothetical protein